MLIGIATGVIVSLPLGTRSPSFFGDAAGKAHRHLSFAFGGQIDGIRLAVVFAP